MQSHKINAAKSTKRSDVRDDFFGLRSEWSDHVGPHNSGILGRFEGEISNLVVYGEIPKDIDGTFYRIMIDPAFPMHPDNPPIEGDGNISAFRIYDGRVEMKVKYVETERYLLERKANRRLFTIYRNPFSHHPCVQAATESTANTNLVHWAGKLLALKEGALPYAVDPDTLDTLTYDPFGQVRAKTFTAHPKIDPYRNELAVFGFEAKGLATPDIVLYAVDNKGKIKDEQWIKDPHVCLIHDACITENFYILLAMPFEATSIEEMKAGGQHWRWKPERPSSFIVCPRRSDGLLPHGWKAGEYRRYTWNNCLCLHAGSAWEEDDGKLYVQSTRIFYNVFPIFNPPNYASKPDLHADFVRWEIDSSQPDDTKLPDPQVIVDLPSEMPRIDERYISKKSEIVFINVILPDKPGTFVPIDLNAILKVNTRTGETLLFDPGEDAIVAEPIFIPRSERAPEGDGWVMAMVDRRQAGRCDLVLLNSNDFSMPAAIIRLPFRLKEQIHGNWVPNATPGSYRSLLRPIKDIQLSANGALEPL